MALFYFYIVGVVIAFFSILNHNHFVVPADDSECVENIPFFVVFLSWIIVLTLFIGSLLMVIEKLQNNKPSCKKYPSLHKWFMNIRS